MKNSKSNEPSLPDFLIRSMNNCNHLLSHLSNESKEELGWSHDTTELTHFGIWMNLINKENKSFPVIVCPEEFSESGVLTDKLKNLFYPEINRQ